MSIVRSGVLYFDTDEQSLPTQEKEGGQATSTLLQNVAILVDFFLPHATAFPCISISFGFAEPELPNQCLMAGCVELSPAPKH